MNKLCVLISCISLISGCASQVNDAGKKVFITPANSAHLSKCELIGQVSIETNVGGLWDYSEMRKQLKVELREQTAKQYPTADTVSYSDLDFGTWTGSAEVMGSVFKCFK